MADVQQEWKDQQERDILFSNSELDELPRSLLEIGPTNRVVTVAEARLLIVLGQMSDYMTGKPGSWSWLKKFGDRLEEYQLTVGNPENSRVSFLRALRVRLGLESKEKSNFEL